MSPQLSEVRTPSSAVVVVETHGDLSAPRLSWENLPHFQEVHRAWVLSVSRIPERHGRHPVFTPASVGQSAPSPPKCSYFRARRRKEGVGGRKRTHTACASSFRRGCIISSESLLFFLASAFSLPFISLVFMRSLSTNVTPPPVLPISHHWHQIRPPPLSSPAPGDSIIVEDEAVLT